VATKVERLVDNDYDAFFAAVPVHNTKWILVIKESPDEILSPLQKGNTGWSF
jgi:two-component system, NtrC family, sensor kinase